MKIYICADGEGVSGVVSSEEMHYKGREWEHFRKLMTMDVNVAIQGAFEAGATEVVVNDAHWNSLNLIYEELDPRADIIRGSTKELSMVHQVDQADGLFFIGLHSKVGHSHGVGNESYFGPEMYEMRMNGKPIGELELFGAIAGYYDVPVLMVSGDDCLADEAKESIGDIETAIVKYSINRFAARCLSLERAHKEIKEKAYRAVKRLNEIKPYKVEGPVEFEVEWTGTAECKKASLVPGTYMKSPRIIAYKGETVMEAWKGIYPAMLLGASAFDKYYG
ncbi:M55 family metallopeptidase [Bacillus litorisediminis]|uniref:M55 family metallopeptidase n=1 Tax=Bacillus litorisediminis TaxID=2922713 RepID=UPI001FAB59BC|nr:M55 family metallopeptidase [Bacillus litorisediminis]